MARPREFDIDDALETAMHLFWQRGYAATSVADLIDAIGISRSSLYQAFGDKDELFLAALQRYEDAEVSRLLAALRDPEGGLGAVKKFFDGLVRHLASPRGRYGCLATNTATELAVTEPRVRAQVAAIMAVVERALRDRLSVARAKAEIAPDANVRALARHLTAVAQGLQVLAKTEPGERYLRDAASIALSAIPRGT